MTRKNSSNHESTASYILLTEKHISFIWRIYLPCLQMLKNSKSSSKLRLYSFLLPSQKSSWLTPESIFEKLLATLARLLILCLQIEQSVESVVNNIGEDWMEPLSWLLYCLLEPLSSPRLYWDINNLRRSSMAASEQPLPTSKADHLWSFPPIFCLKTLLIFCFWFDLDLFRFSIFD